MADGRKAAVGYGDGTARVFDLKSGEVAHSLSGHTAAVVCLSARHDNNLLASGGVDGVARVFSLHSSKTVGTYVCGRNGGGEKDGGGGEDDESAVSRSTVEAVLFSPRGSEQNLLVTGSLEGVVNVWDMSTQVGRRAFGALCGQLSRYLAAGGILHPLCRPYLSYGTI